MKATGIVRRIDDLGRVVIPMEIRRTMRIREGDPLEIFTTRDGEVIFKKYSLIGGLEVFAAQKFLADGNRVKVSVRFRGREMAHTEIGRDLLNKFAEQCAETATLEKAAKMEGRNMSIFLSPKAGK